MRTNRDQGNKHQSNDSEDELNEINEKEVQKGDLALAYIIPTISQNFKAVVRKMRCPARVETRLKMILQAVSEAAVHAKLSALQNILIRKGEYY